MRDLTVLGHSGAHEGLWRFQTRHFAINKLTQCYRDAGNRGQRDSYRSHRLQSSGQAGQHFPPSPHRGVP